MRVNAGTAARQENHTMRLSERIAAIEAQRNLPSNVIPMAAPKERRTVARWIEIQQQSKSGKDLTGYISGDAA